MNSGVSHLEITDVSTGSTQRLYEPPLDMFGADAVGRWFNTIEIREIADFEHHLSA